VVFVCPAQSQGGCDIPLVCQRAMSQIVYAFATLSLHTVNPSAYHVLALTVSRKNESSTVPSVSGNPVLVPFLKNYTLVENKTRL
jgi:hypothetical protein